MLKRLLHVFGSLMLCVPVAAQGQAVDATVAAAVAAPRAWDLTRCAATAAHVCTLEHLEADLAAIIADGHWGSISNLDSRDFLNRITAEDGGVEKIKELNALAAELADRDACLGVASYREISLKSFEDRKLAARTVKEEKKIDLEELEWFGFNSARHGCSAEHIAKDLALLVAEDTAHARDKKWQKNELKRQTKARIPNPLPLADPTTDALAYAKLRHEAVIGLAEHRQGIALRKQDSDARSAAIWSAVAGAITAGANGYAAGMAAAPPVYVPPVYEPPVYVPLPVYTPPTTAYLPPVYSSPTPSASAYKPFVYTVPTPPATAYLPPVYSPPTPSASAYKPFVYTVPPPPATAYRASGRSCMGYTGPGGVCYAGPGGPAYAGPGGPMYPGPGGGAYAGPGGPMYTGPGGGAYAGPGGPAYAGPGGPCYAGPGGPMDPGPGGGAYAGPGGPAYAGPGGGSGRITVCAVK